MGRQKQRKQPWWELPAKSPGEPHYVREREHFRAELARAWRADDAEGDWHRKRGLLDPRPRHVAA